MSALADDVAGGPSGATRRRWPVVAFVVLALATIGAFFVTQALKVTTPLIAGLPAPFPSTIDPVNGGICPVRNYTGKFTPVSFRRMTVSFYLLNEGDQVDVYMLNQDGEQVAKLPGSGRLMPVKSRRKFVWNGRLGDGTIAPDGQYDIQVVLVHQGRNVLIAKNTGAVEPVTVQTKPPPLAVTSVSPTQISSGSNATVTINYTGNDGIRPLVRVYRLNAAGTGAQLVKTYAATSRTGTTAWNGTLAGGVAAPAGRYLLGLSMLSRTCERVSWPQPVTAAAAPHAIVTVQ